MGKNKIIWSIFILTGHKKSILIAIRIFLNHDFVDIMKLLRIEIVDFDQPRDKNEICGPWGSERTL
jgi:hypothetical protein